MTIASKFTLALLTCVVVAFMAYAFLAVHAELDRLDADIVQYEATTANALRPAIRDVWQHDGESRARELIAEAQKRLGGVEVRLVSLDLDAQLDKRPRVPLARLAQLRPGHDVVVVDRNYERDGRIFTYVRVHFAEPSAAAIEVSRSLAGHAAVRADAMRRAIATALLIAIAAGVVTHVLGLALVGRPLAALVAQTHRIGEGDLSYRITVRHHDEIAALAREMNRMCERLREARESEQAQASQLRHSDRLATVGELAAGLAHELGTPLNVIRARARQMERGSTGVGEKARIVVEQVDRMTKLIRQLLDFARKRELETAEVDVRTLVGHAVTLIEPIARTRSLALAVKGDEQPLPGRVDSEQMTQVVLNLVMNAVHATASGGAVSVKLGRGRAVPPAEASRGEQACVCIEVHDEGSGIAPEALPHIFDPFFTTKDVGEGTGLGLSVAYGIVKDHGGWIDVASRVGEGSTFTVWLPDARQS